jgi:hypothetical protein
MFMPVPSRFTVLLHVQVASVLRQASLLARETTYSMKAKGTEHKPKPTITTVAKSNIPSTSFHVFYLNIECPAGYIKRFVNCS